MDMPWLDKPTKHFLHLRVDHLGECPWNQSFSPSKKAFGLEKTAVVLQLNKYLSGLVPELFWPPAKSVERPPTIETFQ
jgi:hypothetical protein